MLAFLTGRLDIPDLILKMLEQDRCVDNGKDAHAIVPTSPAFLPFPPPMKVSVTYSRV
jgi:hypothetical protein